MHLFCLWAYIAVALKKHRFRKNGSFAKSIIHDRPKPYICQKHYTFHFFRKLLVEDGGGAVGEEETDPVDRGQQVFWKTIWNLQKYL